MHEKKDPMQRDAPCRADFGGGFGIFVANRGGWKINLKVGKLKKTALVCTCLRKKVYVNSRAPTVTNEFFARSHKFMRANSCKQTFSHIIERSASMILVNYVNF